MNKPPISVPTESRPSDLVFEYLNNIFEPERVGELHGDALQNFLDWLREHYTVTEAASSSLLPVGRQREHLDARSWMELNFEYDKSGRGYIRNDNGNLCSVQDVVQLFGEHVNRKLASLPVGESRWAILFDDPEVEREVFVGNGAEEAAKKRYVQCLNNWNCYLFKEVGGLGESPPRTHDCSKNLIASEERGSLGNGDWPAHCGQCGRSFRNRDELNRFAGRGETTSAE